MRFTEVKRKVTAVILSLSLMIACLPALSGYTVQAGGSELWAGEGTAESPWLIQSDQGLKALADMVNNGNNYKWSYFKLTEDITLSGDWTPIGKAGDKPFSGFFDGADHTISGINISNSYLVYAGLFGKLEGTVKNLKVNGYIYGSDYSGGIAGYNSGTVIDCELLNGSTIKGINNVGGIVGYNTGYIYDCVSSGIVTDNGQYESTIVGGIAGLNSNVISGCNSTKDCNVQNKVGIYAGGIAGQCNENGSIISCVFEGEVTGNLFPNNKSVPGKRIGGIVGLCNGYTTIRYCKNKGSISCLHASVGGIAGGIGNEKITFEMLISGDFKNTTSLIEYCINDGIQLTGGECKGGIAAYCLPNGRISNCINLMKIESNGDNTGGIAGYIRGYSGKILPESSLIEYCTNYGEVVGSSADSGGNNAGGIVGYSKDGMVRQSINKGEIHVCSKDMNGGIVGCNDNGNIEYCINYSPLTVTDAGRFNGGIVGYNNEGNVNYCLNETTAKIKGSLSRDSINNQVNGGIAGECIGGTVSNCINNADFLPLGESTVMFRDRSYHGGIVGYALKCEINNCLNNGTVYGYSTGGIVGNAGGAYILNCTNNGNIFGSNDIGGIVGEGWNDYRRGIIENCRNNGNVETTSTNSHSGTGGIAGYTKLIVNNCYNHGNVFGSGWSTGGIVGEVNYTQLTLCLNDGYIHSKGDNNYIGGITGWNDNSTITKCQNRGEVTGIDGIGGITGMLQGKCEVSECKNTGYAHSTGKWTGGIAGEVFYCVSNIHDNYNTGIVYGENIVGGIVGQLAKPSKKDNLHIFSRNYCKSLKSGKVDGSDGIDCNMTNGKAGALIGELNDSSLVTMCDNYWWSRCADLAIGNNLISNTHIGDDYDYYYYESRFADTEKFKNWDFNNVWVINSDIPRLRYELNTNYQSFGCTIKYTDIVNDYMQFGSDDTSVWGGRVVIRNVEDLKDLAEKINTGVTDYYGCQVALNTDLYLTDEDWMPIGNYYNDGNGNAFCGTFDGQGHTIVGLDVNRGYMPVGLFGYISDGAVIKNLKVEGNVTSTSVGQFAGGIVGIADNDSVIENCAFIGNVEGNYYTGGIVGCIYNTAWNIESIDVEVYWLRNCYHIGNVSSADNYAGGVAGKCGCIKHCFQYGGTISAPSGKAGSVVGELQGNNDIFDCYAENGSCIVNGNENMVGYKPIVHFPIINYSSSLNSDQFKEKTSFETFDFEDEWVMGADYPCLKSLYGFVSNENDNIDEPDPLTIKENTPDAVFTATGENCGILSGLESGITYTMSGAATGSFTAASDSYTINEIKEGTLELIKKSTGYGKPDSDPQNIIIFKSVMPKIADTYNQTGDDNTIIVTDTDTGLIYKTDCSSAGNDGTITGLDEKYEYRRFDSDTWITGTGETITNLYNGTYYIRTKAYDNRLASDQAMVYIDIYKDDNNVKKPVSPDGLVYNGKYQELIIPGIVPDGKFLYVVSDSETEAPEIGWEITVPVAKEAGTYYVWYKSDTANEQYNGIKGCLQAKIYRADSLKLNIEKQVVLQADAVNQIVLEQYSGFDAKKVDFESDVNDSVKIDFVKFENGKLYIKVAGFNGITEISGNIIVTLTSDNNYERCTINIPIYICDDALNITLNADDSIIKGIVVDGLNSSENISVIVTIPDEYEDFKNDDIGTAFSLVFDQITNYRDADYYYGAKTERQNMDISITGDGNEIHDTGEILEIGVYIDLVAKENFVLFRNHDGIIKTFKKLSERPTDKYVDGTWYLDKENGVIYIYTKYFSTYSIGYTTGAASTISFDARSGKFEDGTDNAVRVIPYNDSIKELPVVTRDGYEFAGWYNSTGETAEQVTVDTVVTGNLTLFARWRMTDPEAAGQDIEDYCTVSFDSKGGSQADAQKIKLGSTIGFIPESERSGFVFEGWFDSENDGNKLDDQTIFNSDITYYAHWSEVKNDNTPDNNESNNENGNNAENNNETSNINEGNSGDNNESNNNNAGNSGNNNGTSNDNNSVYVESVSYVKVKFNTECETTVPEITIRKGTSIGKMPEIKKEGYDFDGWYLNDKKWSGEMSVESDMLLTAHWSKQIIKLTKEMVTLSFSKHEYTGKVLKPKVILNYGDIVLVADRDYVVGYTSNKNIGKGIVTITGIGDYEGTVKKSFKIISPAKGKTFTVAGNTYLISSTKKHTVSFIGTKKTGKIVVPDEVKIGGIVYKITSISEEAFKENEKITSITIGENVKSIGKNAFDGCEGLKKLIIKTALLKSKNIAKDVFKALPTTCKVYVPEAMKEKYIKIFKTKGLSSNAKIKTL